LLSLHRRGFEGLRLERALPSLFPDPILGWCVPEAQPRSGAAFDALLDPGFEPSAEPILAGGPGLSGSARFTGTSRLLVLRPDRVRVEVEASEPGLLVLADAYDPGWTATVNGRAATALRANVAFRAVPVPAGRHEVEMVYRPPAVVQGLALTLAAAGRGGRGRRGGGAAIVGWKESRNPRYGIGSMRSGVTRNRCPSLALTISENASPVTV
jgi:hypothetical protein